MSAYEILQIVLSFTLVIIAILNYTQIEQGHLLDVALAVKCVLVQARHPLDGRIAQKIASLSVAG